MIPTPATGLAAASRKSRREFLRVGGLSALGLTLPQLFRAEASRSGRGEGDAPARACIFLFLAGGPSQFETFDPKPHAPTVCRSLFPTVATSVPGTFLAEPLPDLARQAHRLALLRAVWHTQGGHFGGHRYALTGHAAPGNPDQAARADDRPGLVGLAARSLAARTLPPAFLMPWPATDQGTTPSGGMNAGTLGRQHDPVLIDVDPASLDRSNAYPVFRVPEFALPAGITADRLAGRRGLLDTIDGQRQQLAEAAGATTLDGLYRQAFDLLGSPAIRQGFELEREAIPLRDRYGRNAFGQSCLLARRLIERGARFVQVNFARSVTQKGYGWDTHEKGEATLRDDLLPKLNAGLGTLLDDLADRGLLDETLVVAAGEFGRTPRVKTDGGRDHWPNCYSLLLAGGGTHGGLVYGKSDRQGAFPVSDPVEARELLRTILALLGIPPAMVNPAGLSVPLFEGVEPIRRLYL